MEGHVPQPLGSTTRETLDGTELPQARDQDLSEKEIVRDLIGIVKSVPKTQDLKLRKRVNQHQHQNNWNPDGGV